MQKPVVYKVLPALSGFLRNLKKQKIFFVFLFNGPNKYKNRAEKLFEKLIEIVWKHS